MAETLGPVADEVNQLGSAQQLGQAKEQVSSVDRVVGELANSGRAVSTRRNYLQARLGERIIAT